MASISPQVLDCYNSPHVPEKSDNHIRLTITGITQDVSTNKTKINYSITVEGTPWTTLHGLYVSLGGTVLFEQYDQILASWYAGQVIKQGTVEFDNATDGKLTLTAYIKQLFYYTFSWARWNNNSYIQQASVQMTCSQIARVSDFTLSQEEAQINDKVIITIDRKSEQYMHNIYYQVTNNNERKLVSNVETQYTYLLPANLADECPNTDNTIMTIRVETLLRNQVLGSTQKTLKIKIPDDITYQPAIDNVKLTEAGNVPSDLGFFVQDNSRVKGVITARAGLGASIIGYSVSINGESFVDKEFTTSIITSVNPKLTITVKDSRGRTRTYEQTVTVLEYKVPTITSFASYRDANNQSKINISFTCIIYKLKNKNQSDFEFYYKLNRDSDYKNVKITNLKTVDNGNTITYSADYSIIDSDINSSYDTYMSVEDLFKKVKSSFDFINTSFRLLNISADKRNFAVGKLHEKEGYNEKAIPEIYYENIYREEGDYNGIVLSCPSILDGKITFNSSTNSLELSIDSKTYEIKLNLKEEKA